MTSVGSRAGLVTRGWHGIAAGLAGGIIFGIMMTMMGMMSTIAMMVGSSSVAVGWLVHLVISAGYGVLFALIVPAGLGVGATLGAGAVYGIVLWVIGPLLIMPAMMGMPLFMFNTTAMMSLLGHIIYGLVVAGVLIGLRRRVAQL
ncbi:DUF1440 domain-containing protein [Pseudonocardia nigra]|uniref:DUF1440 domain-containing protein n=1 Tax=Pseudonocardia nigra TaxID=1921578 RepID=UPI001C601394|nr:DUF1440 domain-containing protein [Pseudonocardia nigra]